MGGVVGGRGGWMVDGAWLAEVSGVGGLGGGGGSLKNKRL